MRFSCVEYTRRLGRGSSSTTAAELYKIKRLPLCSAMREQGVSNVRLAALLIVSESAVRRLVNPDHLSRLDGVVV
jgi:predicted transcriptional regulator